MYIPVVKCLTRNGSSSYVLHQLVWWGVSNFGSRLIKSRENRLFWSNCALASKKVWTSSKIQKEGSKINEKKKIQCIRGRGRFFFKQKQNYSFSNKFRSHLHCHWNCDFVFKNSSFSWGTWLYNLIFGLQSKWTAIIARSPRFNYTRRAALEENWEQQKHFIRKLRG